MMQLHATTLRRMAMVAALATIAATPALAQTGTVQPPPPPTSPSPSSSPPTPAPPPQTLATAGLWTAYAANGTDGQPVCGLSTIGADGRQIMVQQVSGQNGVHVVLDKPSWVIPDSTTVDVSVRIDAGGVMDEHASGNGTRLTVDLPFDRSVVFMRAMRYGSQIQVQFPAGNEPAWTGGLRGSSAMIDAFNECRARFGAPPPGQPTQPFVPAPRP